jgi:DNA-binding beta-propeller fold protein YncE
MRNRGRGTRLALILSVALLSLGVLAAPGSAAVGDISYEGCVSNDGSGGLCADAPGTPLRGAGGVAVSPDGKSVYMTSFTSGTISHFFVGPQGRLTFDGCISNDGSGGLCADAPGTPLQDPTGVAVSPDGTSVYVVGEESDDVVHFFAAPQGQLSYDGCISDGGSGGFCADAPGSPLTRAFRVAVSPDGRSVYVASGDLGTVTHFFAAPQGQLSYDGCVSNDGSGGLCADAPGSPLSGAFGVAVSPDGKSVYVASDLSDTITHFFAAPQGQLSYDGCISDDGSGGLCAEAPGSPLDGTEEVTVSPGGHSVYESSF